MDRRIEFFVLYKRVYQALSTAINEGFSSREITLPQYLVLSALQREPRLSSAEVARRVNVSAQAANVMIARLEAMNLIRRRPAASGRALEATLTRSGESALVNCRQISLTLGDHIFEVLTRRDADTMMTILSTLAQTLDRPQKVRPLRAWDRTVEPARATGRGSAAKAKPRRGK